MGGRRMRLWAASLLSLASLVVTGCSGGGDDGEPSAEATESAGEVCDGVFDGAAAALEELSGRRNFSEFRGGGPTADLAAFASALPEADAIHVNFCHIYTEVDWEEPYAALTFGWWPEGSESGAEEEEAGLVHYESGEFAFASDSYASVGFPCSLGDGEPVRTAAGNFSTYSSGHDPDLYMELLNAAARALAERLGCLEESGLPEGAPGRAVGG